MKDFRNNHKLGILRYMTLQSGYKRDLWSKRMMPQAEKSKKLLRQPTAAEINQRQKFAMATKFVAKIKDALKVGFAKKPKLPSSYVLKNLLNDAIAGEYPNLEIDYSKVLISTGNLSNLYDPHLISNADGTGELNWILDPQGHTCDLIYLLLFDSVSGQVFYSDYVGNYLESRSLFKIPLVKEGHILHGWVFTTNRKGRDISYSDYFKVVTKGLTKE